MKLKNFDQTAYSTQHSNSTNHHRLQVYLCRDQSQQRHQQPPPQHQDQQPSRSLSLLLLPRSPVAIICLLIISSAWAPQGCSALHSVSPDSQKAHNKTKLSTNVEGGGGGEKVRATPNGGNLQSKKTILPFHFKLLQDYLHRHRADSSLSDIKPHTRYPVQMLFPPGVLITAGSSPLWGRSRRSAPLERIAVALRSRSHPSFDPFKMAQVDRDVSIPSFPLRDEALVRGSLVYPANEMFDSDWSIEKNFDKQVTPSKLKSKAYSSRFSKTNMKGKLKKIRQKQRIIEALRRRDKAAAARKNQMSSGLRLPTLSESLSQAVQELNSLKTEKAFVREHKNLVPMFEPLENQDVRLQGKLTNDPFLIAPYQEENNFRKAAGQHEDFFTEVADFGPEGKTVREEEWLVSNPVEVGPPPLLPAPLLEDQLESVPIEIQDTLVYDGDFGNGQGFSRLDGLSSDPISGDGFLSSSSDSFSHVGSFGAPVPFPGDEKLAKTSFSSGDRAGFGDFWGDGQFVADDRDCETIGTKTCASNLDCSCYGFYECSQDGRCVALTASSQQSQEPSGMWSEVRPLGFGLSKRHAMQPGKADAKSKSKLDLEDSTLNKPGSRRRHW